MAEARSPPEYNSTHGAHSRASLQRKVLSENLQVDGKIKAAIDNSLLSELYQPSHSVKQLISRLASYQLLPQLLREMIIDRAISQ